MTLKKNKLLIIRFSSIGDIVQAMSVIPTLSDYEIHWATKTEFSNLVSLSLEVKKLLAIPLTPINRPLNTKKIATAKPIKEPPKNAGIGVKLIMYI